MNLDQDFPPAADLTREQLAELAHALGFMDGVFWLISHPGYLRPIFESISEDQRTPTDAGLLSVAEELSAAFAREGCDYHRWREVGPGIVLETKLPAAGAGRPA